MLAWLGLVLPLCLFGCVGATGDADSVQGAGLTASPGSVSFGNVNTGSVSTRLVTVTNSTPVEIPVANVSISGAGFSATGISAGLVLAPGQGRELSVSFAPASAASVSGSVRITTASSPDALVVSLSGTGVPRSSHSVTLTWSASTSNVAGYRAYRSTARAGPYTPLNLSPNPQLRYVDSSVEAGATYYYVVTAVAADGTESLYSEVASAAVPK